MALVLKLRPQERLVNGALIRNASDHSITLHLMNRATLLHERDILLPENAKTPVAQLYLLIQALLLEEASDSQNRNAFVRMAAQIYAKAMVDRDDDICALVPELIKLVAADDHYRALRLLKPMAVPAAKKSPKPAVKKPG
jgi:flagellar protein FlbT